MTQPILWADFVPGAALGEITLPFDDAMVSSWESIFGKAEVGDASQAAGVAVAMMMRAYLTAVAPRPPGNVHARQRFSLKAVPERGEGIRTVVSCRSKEIRRERRYVDLDVQGTGDAGRPIYTGILTLVWAA